MCSTDYREENKVLVELLRDISPSDLPPRLRQRRTDLLRRIYLNSKEADQDEVAPPTGFSFGTRATGVRKLPTKNPIQENIKTLFDLIRRKK